MQSNTGSEAEQAHEGHEHEEEAKWERWSKDRVFVRAMVGKYGEVYQKLLEQPRVYKSRDFKLRGGPGQYARSVISPHSASIASAA